VLDEVERRRVQPLQIVEKQRERVLPAREYPEEAPEHHLKTALSVSRQEVHDRWVFADRFAPPAPKQHHRAGDLADPLWGLLDMTPEGRGDFFPKITHP
jgi:hypothetical protein